MESNVHSEEILPQKPSKLTRTQPLPFSFEARNEALRRKKDEFIQRVYADEKKAREFHARPIPKSVQHAPKTNSFHGSPVKNKETKIRFVSIVFYSFFFRKILQCLKVFFFRANTLV